VNSTSRISLSGALSGPANLRGILEAVIRRVTWRVAIATFAISLVVDAWSILDIASDSVPQIPAAYAFLSLTIVNLAMAFCIMFATLVADEMVTHGVRRLLAYAGAVIVGCAAGALVQWQVHEWLHLRGRYEVPGDPTAVPPMLALYLFFEYLIWGGTIVAIYVNRRTALLASARMNAAQVERARAQRRTLQSRLQALQARVEPQFLFSTLVHVRDLYEHDPEKGGRTLDDLTVYLRAALPHLGDSTSNLAQELALVAAYWRIMRARREERFAFDIDAPPATHAARVPPMILLPLVDQLLAGSLAPSATGGAVLIAARRNADRLRLEISSSCDLPAAQQSGDTLRDIRDRLGALYGERATFDLESSASFGFRVVMETPYETADGRHR
jgi:hypothetical protein